MEQICPFTGYGAKLPGLPARCLPEGLFMHDPLFPGLLRHDLLLDPLTTAQRGAVQGDSADGIHPPG